MPRRRGSKGSKAELKSTQDAEAGKMRRAPTSQHYSSGAAISGFVFLAACGLMVLVAGYAWWDSGRDTRLLGGADCKPGEVQTSWVGSVPGARSRQLDLWSPQSGRRCVSLSNWTGWASDGVLRQEPGFGRKDKSAPAENNNAEFSVLWSALAPSEVKQLLKAARRLKTDPPKIKDSIDGKPAHEKFIKMRGTVQEEKFHHLVEPYATHVVLPYVRQQYQCPTCMVCSIDLRMYRPGQRRAVPTHRDVAMFATAILPLNSGEYKGGLFFTNFTADDVPERYGGGSEIYLPLLNGDLLVHQNDALHGVTVKGQGERASLIFWIRPAADCDPTVNNDEGDDEGDLAWWETLALRGNADAALRLYHLRVGSEMNIHAADAWGIGKGQGQPVINTNGWSEDERYEYEEKHRAQQMKRQRENLKWLKLAAEGGQAEAMTTLAQHMMQEGDSDG